MNEVVNKVINKIIDFDEFEVNLDLFKKKFAGIIYDLSDDDEMKRAMGDKHSISKVRGGIDSAHKVGKAKAKAECDLWDSEKNRIRGVADTLYEAIDKQIKAHKQKSIDHDNMLQEKVDAISMYCGHLDYESDHKIDQLNELLSVLKDMVIDDSYEHRKNDAIAARVNAVSVLEGKLALLEKQEAQAKKDEEERLLAQKEREEEIARNAAKKAEEKARVAEQSRLEAVEQAEKDRINAVKEAEEKAIKAEGQRLADIKAIKVKAEKDRIDAENTRLEDIKVAESKAAQEKLRAVEDERRQARDRAEEAKRLDDIEKAKIDKKKENQKHRASIHKEAKGCFSSLGFSDEDSRRIVELIKDGKIKNIEMIY